MRRTIVRAIISLAFCLFLLPGGSAQAYNSIKNSWIAYYPDVCPELVAAANACTLCHVGSDNFDRNPYGTTLELNGHDFGAAESVDSDGDGRNNGLEILIDCTLPGDGTSPVESTTWASIKALFDH